MSLQKSLIIHLDASFRVKLGSYSVRYNVTRLFNPIETDKSCLRKFRITRHCCPASLVRLGRAFKLLSFSVNVGFYF